MITLVLEAATYEGSAALLDGDRLIGERMVAMRGREHEALMAAVGELFAEASLGVEVVKRIVCGAGPGSFTSLRIAASIAKGLALATGAMLTPVSSLTLLAASYTPAGGPERVLATLDAMRGEQYVQLHEIAVDGSILPSSGAELVPSVALAETAAARNATVIGPGAAERLHVVPRASAAARITKLIAETEPADLAGWEPRYGRLAEAQVKWESVHGRALSA